MVASVTDAARRRIARGARRRLRTRERLLDAAQRVMARKGVDATTIAEITEAADVGFGSFYNHFASKDDIVAALVVGALGLHGDALDRLARTLSDPAEVIAVSVRHTLRLAEGDPVWGGFVQRRALVDPQLAAGLVRRARRDLRLGIRNGRFSVVDEPTALRVLTGATLTVIRAVLEGAAGARAGERLAEQILRMLGVPAREAGEIVRRPLPSTQPAAAREVA
jgi:AcrR family transcriptional regulator